MMTVAMTLALAAFCAVSQPDGESPELSRARELSELEWTPLHDIRLCGKKDRKARALRKMRGMLYGSEAGEERRVPYDISLYTFLTCVHNPYSLLYTESLNPKFPRSAYGVKYPGGKTSGPWMGCVCSIFSSYVAGFGIHQTSGRIADLWREGVLSRPAEQSARGVEPFDILWEKGHCRAVTGVFRSEDGSVTGVEVSESVSPVVKRRLFTPASFDSLMAARGIVIYRRADMSRQGTPPVYHMPSPLVYNDAVCTYAGDRACFREGDRIIIHCLDLSYNRLEIIREGRMVKSIRLRPGMLVDNETLGIRGNLALDPGAYAVDLSGLRLGYGLYEARLARGGKKSRPASFEIVDCNVRYEDGRLYFSSHNGVPVIYRKDARYRFITPEQLERGWIEVPDYSRKSGLKVVFQGKYGRTSGKVLE